MKKLIFTLLFVASNLVGLQAQNVLQVTSALDDGSAGTLRQVIELAEEGDAVVINQGVSPIVLQGEIQILKKLSIDGKGATIQVAIPGESTYRIFQIGDRDIQEQYDFKLLNATLLGGNVTDNNAESLSDIDNCGGAIATNKTTIDLESSKIWLENVTFKQAKASYSGALQIETNSEAFLKNCVFEGNEAVNRNAGAFYAKGKLAMEDCLFNNNKAAYDGSAVVINATQATVLNSIFENNISTVDPAANNGGALFNTGGAKLVVRNCLFTGNKAENKGGGAFASSGTSTATFVYSTLAGNSMNSMTRAGGAMCIIRGNVSLINCTVTGNSAPSKAGGVYSENANSILRLYNTIITHNYVGAEKADLFVSTGKLAGVNNIIGTTGYGDGINNADITISGHVSFSYNPESILFASMNDNVPSLTNNGGKSMTIALAENGSVAADVGRKMGQYILIGETEEGVKTEEVRFVYSNTSGDWFDMQSNEEVYEDVTLFNIDQREYEIAENATPCLGAFELGGVSGIDEIIRLENGLNIIFDNQTSTLQINSLDALKVLQLYTIAGKLVLTQSSPQSEVILSNLASAIYIVKVVSESTTTTQKILVK